VNVRGKFISAEALRSRRLWAARSLAAGVFVGKNDPNDVDGVSGVDERPIGKNTNNWEGMMEYLTLMEDRWAGGGGMSPNSRDLNPLPRADFAPVSQCQV